MSGTYKISRDSWILNFYWQEGSLENYLVTKKKKNSEGRIKSPEGLRTMALKPNKKLPVFQWLDSTTAID